MQRTLLQVVQKYLDRSSGFYVNSINETDEAIQVASVAEDTYYEMIQEFPNLLFTQKERTLDSIGDATKPTYLLIPQNVQRIQESKVYYNVATNTNVTLSYKELTYLTPLEFISHTSSRTDGTTNTEVVTGFNNEKTVVVNNKFPEYYTSFDDTYVVFDSYNSTYDSTMQAGKSKIISTEETVFLQQDDFVIPIPDALSETYLYMFLDQALNDIHQERNAAIATKARRMRIKMQQDSRRLGTGGRAKAQRGRRGFRGIDRGLLTNG